MTVAQFSLEEQEKKYLGHITFEDVNVKEVETREEKGLGLGI